MPKAATNKSRTSSPPRARPRPSPKAVPAKTKTRRVKRPGPESTLTVRRSAPAPKPPPAPRLTPPYQGRIQHLLTAARAEGVDHLLITNPLDVGYLTGFLGGDSYLLLGPAAGPKSAIILSDGRYQEELEPFHHLVDVVMRTKGMPAAVAETLGAAGITRCAVQAEHLSLADLDDLRRACGQDTTLVPTSRLVGHMREVKDEAEAELIQTAIRIQEAALLAVLPTIRAGQTELEVAAALEAEMKRRGSSQPGFQSIVAARANGSLPHYRPGAAKVAANQPLLIDWGATFMGYQGDMTRTFALGKWPAKMREIYEIVREAQELSAAALAPGKSTHEIDAIAREFIASRGYGDRFDHGLGHGLGMSKEPPFLNPTYAPMELKPGHVVTVEPGIYLPGVGGVRIEDQYIITENGARNFCSLPKDIGWATL